MYSMSFQFVNIFEIQEMIDVRRFDQQNVDKA